MSVFRPIVLRFNYTEGTSVSQYKYLLLFNSQPGARNYFTGVLILIYNYVYKYYLSEQNV